MLTEGAIPTDTFAEFIGDIPEDDMAKLRQLVLESTWRDIPSRNYDTAEVAFWEPCQRAFFIRIPPNGFIPRHHDVFIPGTTHHFVVQTNEGCWNNWLDTKGKERKVHMQQGKRYKVAREPLHWASNHGETDRIHLLVEYA